MAAGAFQKAGIRMADNIGYHLFVHATVQERCHKIVPQRMEMVFLWKTDRLMDFPQTLCEDVCFAAIISGSKQRHSVYTTNPAPISSPINRDSSSTQTTQVRGKINFAAFAVLGCPLYDAPAGDTAAGTTDGEKQAVFGEGEV